MQLKGHHLALLSLVVTVGCFAPVPIVSAPQPPMQPRAVQPTPTPTPPPEEPAANALTAPIPTPPTKPTPPPEVKDPFAGFTFTEKFAWSVSGNTPLVTWSPGKTQLAIYSDYAQVEGTPNNGKKYFDLVDLKTGKLKAVGTITASGYNPTWIDESTLAFLCTKDRCGKGKNGVYISKTSGGAQKQVMPLKAGGEIYASLYATTKNTLLIRTEEYPAYSGTGPYPAAIITWQEWNPSTKKTTLRKDLSAKEYEPPKGEYAPQNYCDTYNSAFFGFALNGSMGITDSATQKSKKILATATPLPYYPGDTNGIPPCVSKEVDQLLYFSLDESTKRSKVTMMAVSGYTAPAAPAPAGTPVVTPEPSGAKDMIDSLTFTQVFSWSVSGNTPFAAWSPGKTKLAVYSDAPQKAGAPKDYKKLVDIVDLKTGKAKKIATITTDDRFITWINESAIGFVCVEELCGKGKGGVYVLNVSSGAPKLILPLDANSYASLYPNKDGKLKMIAAQYYNNPEKYVPPTETWHEYDPATGKTASIEAYRFEGKIPGTIEFIYCQPNTSGLYTSSYNGQMLLINANTSKQRVIAEAAPLPYYPGDAYGVAPCVSSEVDQLIYYSYDEKKKQNKATLMKVGGYVKP